MAEPKVRFKKDDGSSYPEWTVGNLGDYGTFIRGLSYGKDDVTLENDKTLVLRSNNIREDKVLDYLNGLQFVVKKPQNEQLLKNGDIVVKEIKEDGKHEDERVSLGTGHVGSGIWRHNRSCGRLGERTQESGCVRMGMEGDVAGAAS